MSSCEKGAIHRKTTLYTNVIKTKRKYEAKRSKLHEGPPYRIRKIWGCCGYNKLKNKKQVIEKGVRMSNNVYILKEENDNCYIWKHYESQLWRMILCKMNFNHIVKLREKGVVWDAPIFTKPNKTIYKSCEIGKKIRVPLQTKGNSSTKPLQLVYANLCVPTRNETPSGEIYFILVIDNYTRLMWVSFLKEKYEVFKNLKIFKVMVEK